MFICCLDGKHKLNFHTQDTSKDIVGEEQSQSNVNVMCRICFFGEMEGSERARKMLPCNSCGKKYHRLCLKSWSQNRGMNHSPKVLTGCEFFLF